MEIKTLSEIEAESAGNGMSDYYINTVSSLNAYQVALTEMARILKEIGELHEASEHIISLQLIIDRIVEDMFGA